VQGQVAFLRTSYRVGNGGKRPVCGGKQQPCLLNATPDDRPVGEKPMDALKRGAEWEGIRYMAAASAASERSSARWSSLDGLAGLSVVLVKATTRGREGCITDECCLSRWIPRRIESLPLFLGA
jgi:hypothetical protein